MVHVSFFIEFPGLASPHRRLAPAVAVDKKLWPTRRRCLLFLKLRWSFPECFQKFITGLCSTPNDGPDVSKAVQLTQYVKWVFARGFLVIGQDFLNSKASFELAMKFGAHIPIKWRTNNENRHKNQTVGNLSHSCWTLEDWRNLKQQTLNWPFSFLGWALHDVSRVDLICMTMAWTIDPTDLISG